jgi:hypothetical protein
MATSLQKIKELIDNGDKKQARARLKTILKDSPSADTWYLAALAMDSDEDTIKCLHRALKLDALHSPANLLLNQLQEAPIVVQPSENKTPLASSVNMDRQEKVDAVKQQKKGKRRRVGCGCLMSMFTSSIFAIVVLTTIGMIPGLIGTIVNLTSQVAPVYEIENIPIEQVENAVYQLEPVFSKLLTEQDVNFIDHGFVNEHIFDTVEGKGYVVFVQFLSLNTHHTKQNIAINDSEGYNAIPNCQEQKISEYDNGVAYLCGASVSGQWKIRILGINGESVGGYIVGIKSI